MIRNTLLNMTPKDHLSVLIFITITTILRPLYRTTSVSRHILLRTGGFCWSKVLLPTCLCWQQLVHSD